LASVLRLGFTPFNDNTFSFRFSEMIWQRVAVPKEPGSLSSKVAFPGHNGNVQAASFERIANRPLHILWYALQGFSARLSGRTQYKANGVSSGQVIVLPL